MLQKCSTFKIAQVFFDDPEKEFSLSELRRRSKIAHTSVMIHLKVLEKEGIITKGVKKIGKRRYPFYQAKRDCRKYKSYKIISSLYQIEKSGLLGYLKKNCLPDCIILFGSVSRGEDVKESDIDLYIKARKKSLDLNKFEKIIGRKIQLHFREDFKKYPPELKNNILNGIPLSGYLEVF